MVTPTSGWALDASAALHTTDGGTLWVDVSPPGVVLTQNSMAFAIDTRTAWVTATRAGSQAPLLAHTADGGRSWRTHPIPLPDDAAGIARMTFADARHGWLLVSLGAGAGSEGVQILRTTDGGTTWTSVSRTASAQPSPGSLPLSGIKTGISFRDSTRGWVTAEVAGPDDFSWLYTTGDGGSTWQHQRLTFPAPYRQVVPVLSPPRFFTAHDGLLPVILNAPGVNPALDFYATHNGGVNWSATTPLPYKAATGSPSWDFADQDHGWVAIGTTLHATLDGGRHWGSGIVKVGVQSVAQLDFVNAKDGWTLGAPPVISCIGRCLTRQGPLAGAPLLRTVDGGHTWTRLSPYVTYPLEGSVHIEAAG
jgi:photosystem II stability/assembly factor-like uncharacterized protein